MTIYGLEQVSSLGGKTSTTTANKDVMGKDDFLHLLVTQLQAQDPLNPMDSTGFTAQLAQFSSLEQLQNIHTTLSTIGSSQSVLTNSQAVSFIGKTVTAVGDSFQTEDGVSNDLVFTLDKDAAGFYVKIYDAQGNFVRQIEGGAVSAGQQELSWDGWDYLGGRAPNGQYRYEVAAIDDLGNSVGVTTFASGTVTGVNFKDGVAYLKCDGREIPMGNVVQVLAGSDSK